MAGTTLETDGKPFIDEDGDITPKVRNWLDVVGSHLIELLKSGREGELQLRADPFAGIADCKVRYFEPQDAAEERVLQPQSVRALAVERGEPLLERLVERDVGEGVEVRGPENDGRL